MQRSAADKEAALAATSVAQMAQELETIATAEDAVKELAAAVEEQARLEQALAAAQQQQARLNDAHRALHQRREQVNRLETRVAELVQKQATRIDLDAARRTAEGQSETLQGEVERARTLMNELKPRADLIKEQTAKLADVQTAVCPVCEQPLTAAHRTALLERNNHKLAELRQSYAEAQRQVREQDALLQEQKATLQKLTEELMALPRPEEVTTAHQELTRAQADCIEAQAQVEQLAAAPAHVLDLKAQLDALDNPQQRHAIAAEQTRRRGQVEQQLGVVHRQLEAARNRLHELETALAAFAGLDEQTEAVAASLKQHQAAYQAVLLNQRVAETLPNKQKEVATSTQTLAAHQQTVDTLNQELAQASARFDGEAYRQLAIRGQELQGQIGDLQAQLRMLRQRQEQDEQEIAELRSLQGTLADAQDRSRRLTDQEGVLEQIRKVLRLAGPHITTMLVQQISQGARQMFGEIMQDFTRHLSWNDDYGITLEVDGHDRQFAQLSGGEQMSAALAVRLALLREMSNIDVAFFDEPTANLDETRREALARQILAVRGFRQIFVISHDDTFEQATQNLVRVARVDGTSRVMEE
jgi:exonuclease SbcC